MVDGQDRFLTAQRQLTALALDALEEYGFALAGSGAIREHGLIDRPTRDIDLFGSFDLASDPEAFSAASDALVNKLEAEGYVVTMHRTAPCFRALVAERDGLALQMDLGADFRNQPPAQLEIGSVICLDDAIASKVAALFSRGEVRDYLDVDRIRLCSGKTDAELLSLAGEADGGFRQDLFAQALSRASRLSPDEVAPYGFTAADLAGVKDRLEAWSRTIIQEVEEQRDDRSQERAPSLRAEASEAKRAAQALDSSRGAHQSQSRGNQAPEGR